METELVARRAGDGLKTTLRRLASLVGGLVVLALLIGAATFATGWWVFDGSTSWLVLGGLICVTPAAAAGLAWLMVHGAARYAPRLIADIGTFLKSPSPSADVLIDYDTGQPISMSAKRMNGLSADLSTRRSELPALWLGVRAIRLVPALAAITFLGMLVVGGLGTILLIGGVID
ncbi:MAG: hypothetical protein HY828_19625 [Actinobacteria bacterium]|nr:hypothetical protein [Actinomycetota bacterium]